MRVLSLASEAFPLVKTGGLADVAGALPLALPREGVEARTLLPGYPAVLVKLEGGENDPRLCLADGRRGADTGGKGGGSRSVRARRAASLSTGPAIPTWGRTARTGPTMRCAYGALARAGADIGKGLVPAYVADVVHAHDWQAALAPVYLHFDGGPAPRPC